MVLTGNGEANASKYYNNTSAAVAKSEHHHRLIAKIFGESRQDIIFNSGVIHFRILVSCGLELTNIFK